MDTFANRLNQALQLRGITPAELSRRIGVAEGTISNYRKGTYEPKQKRLQVIAEALQVSIPFLLGYDVPAEEEKKPSESDDLNGLFTELVSLYDGLSEENRKKLLEQAQLLTLSQNQ